VIVEDNDMAASRIPRQTNQKTARADEYNNPAAVEAYLTELDHPLKPVVQAIRETILKADSKITEGIKWNSASFYCHGWFATVGARPKGALQVVLHHGAKVKANADLGKTIKDPQGLLTWLSKDRAIVSFTSMEDFIDKRKPFSALIKQWAAYQAKLE
jgi:hypothetical protein